MAAAPGITTSGQPPTAVVQVQPGMNVQPVVLVDQNGNYVSAGGGSGTATTLASLTTGVNVAAATAPTTGQVLTATSGSAATWQTSSSGFANPMTTAGDLIAENTVPTAVRVTGNTTATKNFLTQTGTGSASALPVWGTIASGDMPTGTTSAKGALQLDGTAGDIQPVGASAAAGSVGKPADAGHVHVGLLPSNNLSDVASAPTALSNLGALPTAGGTMSGAIAMGSNKVTGLTNGSGAQDAAAYGQTFAGGSGTPMTTAGDLLYENATPAPARLAIGTSSQLLGVSSGLPAWVSADTTAADFQPGGVATAGSNGKWADSGHVHPATSWIPSDNGLLAAYGDPFIPVDTSVTTTGTLYLVKLPIRYALTLSYTWWILGTAGAGTSSGSFTGLYSSSGTLLTGSSDIASSLTGATGGIKLTLTTPQALSAGTFVWAALLVNLLTTQPTLIRGTGSGANMGLTAATYRIATNSPAATTVASGSNGGEISTIASWANPSAGVLDVATTTNWPTSGSLAVAATGPTLAQITYTGTAAGQFTGCAYVSGSATGTVATGGAVTMASLPASITPSGNATGVALWAGGS